MPPGMTYEKWKEQYAKEPGAVPMDLDKKETARSDATETNIKVAEQVVKEDTEYINPFRGVEDIEQLQAVSKEVFGFEIGYPNMANFELLKDSLGNLGEVFHDFPMLKEGGYLEGISVKVDAGGFAATCWDKDYKNGEVSKIYLDFASYIDRDEFARDIAKMDEKSLKDNGILFRVEGSAPENNALHEAGHLLHNIAAYRELGGYEGMTSEEAREARNMFCDNLMKKAVNNIDPNITTDIEYREMCNTISAYAGVEGNSREAIAEATRDVYLHGEGAKPLSKEIYKILKSYL